ncbi:TRAP transporter TatT component family protein [Chromohalobacter nigrandesensis]|uniref:TRAP transporter TatT component family protein n=1 Tax=Chromohalobacter nigrandesensis TaxID=119863 RepID=UPI001FF0E62C|nr:TRAP transporter TatT component family protein [Chromohalobacter nigrandesensis]MCK0746573.1 TRAP transporter TatT component family protein [Chromohalobacter nigrandesensis]
MQVRHVVGRRRRSRLIPARLHAVLCVALIGVFSSALAWADASPDGVYPLMSRWGNVEYGMQGAAQEKALASLAQEAETLAEAHPDNAHVLTAEGVILASYAQAKGGLGALDLAKRARQALERAIELDPRGDDGAAYVTLGALYDRAPGWPVSFGDDDKAGELLQRALEIRGDGIDTHYFYATYLRDEGRHAEARRHAQQAVDGQAREGRASDEALREKARRLVHELS